MELPFRASAPGTRSKVAQGPLVRWLLAYGTFSVPQAAGPIAFALLAIPLTGNPGDGAAFVLAITVAQVIGAVPVARLGRKSNAVSFLKALVAIRALSLIAVAVLAMIQAPFVVLIAAAALSGLVNGAAFGFLRSVLNHLVEPSRLPRALGLASTLNEFTFVAAPVLASGLGTISPVFALLMLTILGTAPFVLVPSISNARASEPVEGRGTLLAPSIILWLACTAANSAVVSSIEIGSVSLAMRYGFAPSDGFIFTLALCLASVTGGVWVSARNRMPRRFAVVLYLSAMSAGAALIALNLSVMATLVGAVIVGCVLAPLGTYYSLMLDALSAPHRKAEVFALSRTANSIGIILTSANLALTSLAVTQVMSAALIFLATATVATISLLARASRVR
ncbi:MFS transporter [Acidisphaera sp. S103]|uniref:MFS transporter n=1 Tax=Acidisphaera sp. S103 TaxID=1747223 RepID=UPI00131D279C|nr:MFS transporter [Acidisphaera sp. S103]